MRYHAISIAAIFLALAVGVVLGSRSFADNFLSRIGGKSGDLSQQVDQLHADNNALSARLTAADSFNAATAGRIVHGVLDHRTVVLVTAPDADPSDVSAVTRMIGQAGGTVATTVGLTDSFLDPAAADRLRTTLTSVIPAGVQLPTTATDSGSLGGSLLGSVLLLDPKSNAPQANQAESDVALDALRKGGFITGGTFAPANYAVVLSGNGSASAQANANLARFATALKTRGAGVVLGGRVPSAEGAGPIADVRADAGAAGAVTTVDDVDTVAGQITVVLGLADQQAGHAGSYGVGPKASAVTVGVGAPN